MVDVHAVLIRNKIIAPAMSFLLAACLLLTGCSGIMQPSRKALAGANHYLDSVPVLLEVSLAVSTDDVTLRYDTEITAQGQCASWDGEATVWFKSAKFHQVCRTLCDSTGSCKRWRDKWVKSDNTSPIPRICEWLDDMVAGKGFYGTRPVIPSQMTDGALSVDEECYRIEFGAAALDWKAFCDTHLDSLFGRDELLNGIKPEVVLFFGAKDNQLKGIWLVSAGESQLVGAIRIHSSNEMPNILLSDMPISDGHIYEEWSMEGS